MHISIDKVVVRRRKIWISELGENICPQLGFPLREFINIKKNSWIWTNIYI